MSNVEAIKKAIDFYAEYFEDEVLGDLARNAIPSLEALQRENAILQERAADYPTISAKLHDREKSRDAEQKSCREAIERAETAEAEVKRLRNKVYARALTDQQLADEIAAVSKACEGGFGEVGGSPGEWWYERADELEHERKRRELESQLQQHNSRTALASAGEEHHADK